LPGCGTCGHVAAVDLDALADADEALAEAVARRAALAVVARIAHARTQTVSRLTRLLL